MLIAASAVQVTLGLETWDLSYFNHILIYPDEYKNPQSNRYHKGETNLGGFMCFSWKAFLEGNENPLDKINLGLHEFGHALRFNGVKGNQTDYFFENYFPRWVACATKEFGKMRNNKPSIFRKYGSVNINEFFSVVVETFFEAPHEFRTYLPELFRQTAILLNQYIDENGMVKLNCREELLNQIYIRLGGDYSKSIKYNLSFNGHMILAAIFLTIQILVLKNSDHFETLDLFWLLLAALCWMNLERRYSRLLFNKDQFTIENGFLFLKGYKRTTLPLSHLVSFVVDYNYYLNNNEETIKQLNSIRVKHYRDSYFYENVLNCSVNQPDFDLLCDELKENNIHVFIKD